MFSIFWSGTTNLKKTPVPLSAQMQLLCFKTCASKLHNRYNRG